MNIAICDDNVLIVEHIKRLLMQEKNEIHTYTDPHKFKSDFDKEIGKNLDIILMDIVFWDITGIDIIKEIQKKNEKVKVIYISDYTEYTEKIFETEPTYFLVKPITKEKLEKAIDKAMKKEKKTDVIVLGNEKKLLKIETEKIFYFESNKRLVLINGVNATQKIYMKLSELEEKLPDYFVKCHQSYIVNLKKVEKIQNNQFIMQNRRSD